MKEFLQRILAHLELLVDIFKEIILLISGILGVFFTLEKIRKSYKKILIRLHELKVQDIDSPFPKNVSFGICITNNNDETRYLEYDNIYLRYKGHKQPVRAEIKILPNRYANNGKKIWNGVFILEKNVPLYYFVKNFKLAELKILKDIYIIDTRPINKNRTKIKKSSIRKIRNLAKDYLGQLASTYKTGLENTKNTEDEESTKREFKTRFGVELDQV